MSIELKINNRIAKIKLIEQNGNIYKALIDGKEYILDVNQVESNEYSVLYQGKSVNFHLSQEKLSNQFNVNTPNHQFQIEIIDPLFRHKESKASGHKIAEHTIVSPMPGRVVKVLVKIGDNVKEGDTAVIVSAMKMESEFKIQMDGIIAKVNVSAGDDIEGGFTMVEINTQNE
jgi:biotin carboxyl carrier protein